MLQLNATWCARNKVHRANLLIVYQFAVVLELLLPTHVWLFSNLQCRAFIVCWNFGFPPLSIIHCSGIAFQLFMLDFTDLVALACQVWQWVMKCACTMLRVKQHTKALCASSYSNIFLTYFLIVWKNSWVSLVCVCHQYCFLISWFYEHYPLYNKVIF
jgi:hypothetical protein